MSITDDKIDRKQETYTNDSYLRYLVNQCFKASNAAV